MPWSDYSLVKKCYTRVPDRDCSDAGARLHAVDLLPADQTSALALGRGAGDGGNASTVNAEVVRTCGIHDQRRKSPVVGTRGNNEGKACEAVLRFLERRTGYDRSDVRCPEEDGNGPPVELRLRLGRQEYALEHTLIEPFENEIRDGVEFEEIATHIREALSSFAGSACYRLAVPVGARLPRSEDARQRFVDWIVKRAEAMREEAPGQGGPWRSPLRWDACVRAKPPGFSGTFELARWPDAALMGRRPGSLYAVRACPDELEELRRCRLHRALSRKCPKLLECKADGARTVLILESDDIALTSVDVVGDCLAVVLRECRGAPDDIFLVETAVYPWCVWPLKQDALERVDSSAPDGGRWNPALFGEKELSV